MNSSLFCDIFMTSNRLRERAPIFAKMLKNKIQYITLSDKFYRWFLSPFDKILFPVVPAGSLVIKRENQPLPVNKIPNVADIYNGEWKAVAHDMSVIFKIDEKLFHRKIWESIHLIYALRKTGYLFPGNQGLAVGAGREEVLYYLAHKIKKMTAVDLYEGTYVGGEDEPDIPEKPQKYAPFFYPREKLDFLRMDARELNFPDQTFDFILSLSAIEHFGTLPHIEKSIREMYRVLKPGGSCVITSELKLNRLGSHIPNTRIFALKELIELFEKNGFKIDTDEIDIEIEDRYLHRWVKLPYNIYQSPHVILRLFRTFFTSICLVFFKPGEEVERGEWIGESRFETYTYKGEIEVKADKQVLKKGEALNLELYVKNTGNFDWYTDGYSHRIAVHVKLLEDNGNVLDHYFSEIVIPRHIKINDSLQFVSVLPLDLDKGKYKLFFDLKKERVLGYSDRGNPGFYLEIEMT